MATSTKRRKADPDSAERLDKELQALLTTIPRRDPPPAFATVKRAAFLDDRANKVFALNMARIVSHFKLSAERAAKLLCTSRKTLEGWLTAKGKRSTVVVENMARHLGVGGWELVERVMPFTEVERLRLGKGWLPPNGWNRSPDAAPRLPPTELAKDDDDPANWWKANV